MDKDSHAQDTLPQATQCCTQSTSVLGGGSQSTPFITIPTTSILQMMGPVGHWESPSLCQNYWLFSLLHSSAPHTR